MTQDERWNIRYQEVMDFMEKHHRNPSKHYMKEKLKHSWVHHNRKLMNRGELKANRVEMFKKLLSLYEEYRHVNQYA